MTPDDVDRAIADAAIVDDADLRAPAVTAALMATMDALIDRPGPSDRTHDEGATDADRLYVVPAGRRRSPVARRALLAVAAAVLVAAGVGGYVLLRGNETRTDGTATVPEHGEGPPRSEDPTDDTVPVPLPPPDDAAAPPADAPLADRIEFAIDQAYGNNVAVVRYIGPQQITTLTVDRQTGTVHEVAWDGPPGSEGAIKVDSGPAGFNGATPTGERSVDHCRNEYTDTPGYASRTTAATNPFVVILRSGDVVEDGHEVIDGRDTLRLRHVSGTLIWLNADNLWPIRMAPTADSMVNFEYLPRTPENLALLVPSVDGMTKVDKDRSSDPCPS